MKKEYIKRESDGGTLVCLYGNTDTSEGFQECNAQGDQVEPEPNIWNNLYFCDRCKRMINGLTLEVVEMENQSTRYKSQ